MTNRSRAFLITIVTGIFLFAACSRPNAGGHRGASSREASGSPPDPAIVTPAETASPDSGQTKDQEKQKVVPTAKQQSPVKKQAKTERQVVVAETPPPSVSVPVPSAPAPTVPQPAEPQVVEAPVVHEQSPPIPSLPRRITIPANTTIAIRTIDSVDSRTDQAGQTFRASVDSDVIVDDEIVIRRGADVYLKLLQVSSAGDLRGKSELQLQLERIVLGAKSYNIESSSVVRSAAAEGPKTARDIETGAAIEAAIGAIAGGGKGAAIGATAGAGAGAVAAAITKGEQVLVPSETRLEFRLERPLEVEVLAPSSSLSSETRFTSGPRKLGEDSRPSRPETSDRRKATDVTGDWRLSINGPDRTRHLNLWLEQNGTSLKGTIMDTFGVETALRGKVDGDSITFTTESHILGRGTESKYTGRIAGNSLRGTMTVTISGGYPRRLPRGGRLPSERYFDWTAERIEP